MPYLHTRVPRIPRLLVGILVLTASALPALPRRPPPISLLPSPPFPRSAKHPSPTPSFA